MLARHAMVRVLKRSLAVLIIAMLTPGMARVESSTATGDIRLHSRVSSRFVAPRDVWVYLPPGYEAHPGQRYPVLYMHDGNNLFDARIAFLGREWQMDETAERMIRAGELPPLIIVGIGNTADRIDEYTWQSGKVQGKVMGGKGPEYARFLVEELKPFIDRTYRTLPDRAHTGVMGSSLGGLVSLYLARHDGDVFGQIGVMSPSVWWSDRAVLKDLNGLRTDFKIYLDMGGSEDDTPVESLEDLHNARALRDELVAMGYGPASLDYVEAPEAKHNELYWARRAPAALKFLFGTAP